MDEQSKRKCTGPQRSAGPVQGGAATSRTAQGTTRNHAASSALAGRGIPAGQSTQSGQLLENQSIAFSNVPVVRSLSPSAIRSSVDPLFNTIVERRWRPMPRA